MAPRKGSGEFPSTLVVRIARASMATIETEAVLGDTTLAEAGRKVVALGLAALAVKRHRRLNAKARKIGVLTKATSPGWKEPRPLSP